ncbi:hypothetical protein BVX98_05765 [bacterium F11]|nr:hypothetical protein BVX98_05765 [bacterium F11]
MLYWLKAIKGSFVAFGVSLGLGFLSMGILGYLLAYVSSPILCLRYPAVSKWHGDWVWPAMILVGMAWSFGFLIAGFLNYYLLKLQTHFVLRWIVYLAVLWLWALIIWFLALLNSSKGV